MLTGVQPPIFVDSVYYIAINQVGDQWRVPALRAAADIRTNQQYLTTYGILAETLARFSRSKPLIRTRIAVRLQALAAEDRYTVIAESAQLMTAALDLYAGEFASSSFSLQDCVAIQIMREYGITSILTADQEFARAGFTPLLRRYI